MSETTFIKDLGPVTDVPLRSGYVTPVTKECVTGGGRRGRNQGTFRKTGWTWENRKRESVSKRKVVVDRHG